MRRRNVVASRLMLGALVAVVPSVVWLPSGSVGANSLPSLHQTGAQSPLMGEADLDFSEDLRLRNDFGFDSSLGTIELAHSLLDQGSSRVNMDFGVPLFVEESDEIIFRVAIAAQTRDALPAIIGREQLSLGGFYMNNQTGHFVVLLKTLDEQLLERVREEVPFPDRTDVRAVEYRSEELDQLADTIILDTELFAGTNIQTVQTNYEFEDDMVVVTVDGDTDQALGIILERYPEWAGSIRVAQALHKGADYGTQYPEVPPWRGGQSIRSDRPKGCTSGFVASTGSGSELNTFVLTAGHCGLRDDTWDQGSTSFGFVGFNARTIASVYNARADALKFKIAEVNGAHTIVEYPGNPHPILSWQRRTVDGVGDPVCVSRQSLQDISCGAITAVSLNLSRTDSFGRTATFIRLRRATYISYPGDSGAPTYWDNKAMGLNKGIDDSGNSIYVHVEDALDELNVDRIDIN